MPKGLHRQVHLAAELVVKIWWKKRPVVALFGQRGYLQLQECPLDTSAAAQGAAVGSGKRSRGGHGGSFERSKEESLGRCIAFEVGIKKTKEPLKTTPGSRDSNPITTRLCDGRPAQCGYRLERVFYNTQWRKSFTLGMTTDQEYPVGGPRDGRKESELIGQDKLQQ